MAYYGLNKNIGLRRWHLVTSAYYIYGRRNAEYISPDKFDILVKCDSNHNLEKSKLIEELIAERFIFECKQGEYPFDSWQYKDCDNRYFPAINWMITGKCNYNCLHCFNAVDNNPLADEFSLKEANSLLDEAEKAGINAFTITGGEPMCHKNFFEIIEGIHNRGMYVEELNTNGFYITKESLKRLKGIGENPLIKISFDGIGYHDWLRNAKGAEDDAIRAIKLCIDEGFRVKVQTNVNKNNLTSMIDTILLMNEMGVYDVRIIRTSPTPRWNLNANHKTFSFLEYYDAMLELVDRILEIDELKTRVDIWNFLQLFPHERKYRIRPVVHPEGEYRDSFPVCLGNRGMIAVGANGNLYPCMQVSGIYDSHNEVLANVKTQGLINNLKFGKYIDTICLTVKDLAEINKECGECKFFKYCAGGCRALAMSEFDDYYAKDSAKCQFFMNGYYDKIIKNLGDWHNLTPIGV